MIIRIKNLKFRAYVFLLDLARPEGRGDREDRETGYTLATLGTLLAGFGADSSYSSR